MKTTIEYEIASSQEYPSANFSNLDILGEHNGINRYVIPLMSQAKFQFWHNFYRLYIIYEIAIVFFVSINIGKIK